MPNVNTHPAGAASASLALETTRPTAAPAAVQEVQAPKAVTLSTGEQVQLESYTVKKGDTLWDIAGVKLGDSNKWPMLLALNRQQISNPDFIKPGQVLSVPVRIQAAPEVPKPVMPNPDPGPAAEPAQPVQPAQPAQEIPIAPSEPPAPAPAPAEEVPVPPSAPPAPVQAAPEEPVAPPAAPAEPEAPAQPAQSEKPLLRHPSEIGTVIDSGQQPAAVELTPIEITPPAQAPAEEPAQTPAQTTGPAPAPVDGPKPPVHSIVSSIPQAENKGSGLGKAALIGGVVGTASTGALLIGMTSKIGSNLGGYATAQVVAKGINTVTSKVGLKLPTGPALSKLVTKVGGPKVAGTVAAVGTGLVVAGLAAGGYYLYTKATGKNDTPAPQPTAKPADAPAQLPTAAAAAPVQASAAPLTQGELDWAEQMQTRISEQKYNPTPEEAAKYTDIFKRYETESAAAAQPAAQPSAQQPAPQPAPVAKDVSAQMTDLTALLKEKQYMFFGANTQPEKIRATGVQIWLDGNTEARVQLANTLVSNGQSDLLGRVMAHEETNAVEIAEVMSNSKFPVGDFMKALDDNRAYLILDSLAKIASTGEAKSAGVLAQVVTAYDGWRDREAPFKQLKQSQTASQTWDNLPADLRGKIDELLK